MMRIRVKIRKKGLEDERGGNEGGKEDKKNNQTAGQRSVVSHLSDWLVELSL